MGRSGPIPIRPRTFFNTSIKLFAKFRAQTISHVIDFSLEFDFESYFETIFSQNLLAKEGILIWIRIGYDFNFLTRIYSDLTIQL